VHFFIISPLSFLAENNPDQKDLNERKQKWVRKLQAYEFNIEYVKGKKNVVDNALYKRLELCSLT
jgi:hypothetical protein